MFLVFVLRLNENNFRKILLLMQHKIINNQKVQATINHRHHLLLILNNVVTLEIGYFWRWKQLAFVFV